LDIEIIEFLAYDFECYHWLFWLYLFLYFF
jgi:hypothetical protein